MRQLIQLTHYSINRWSQDTAGFSNPPNRYAPELARSLFWTGYHPFPGPLWALHCLNFDVILLFLFLYHCVVFEHSAVPVTSERLILCPDRFLLLFFAPSTFKLGFHSLSFICNIMHFWVSVINWILFESGVCLLWSGSTFRTHWLCNW